MKPTTDLTVACIRMTGYAVSEQMRLMQKMTRTALSVPFYRWQVMTAATEAWQAPLKPAAKVAPAKAAPKAVAKTPVAKAEAAPAPAKAPVVKAAPKAAAKAPVAKAEVAPTPTKSRAPRTRSKASTAKSGDPRPTARKRGPAK